MKDIARDVGVSVVTVSKVLRNHSDISAKTRDRVLNRIQELGYKPNITAQCLATGRSYLMGLVVPDLVHPFFSLIAKGASRVLRKQGFSLIMSSSEENSRLEAQELAAMVARNVDVVMLASAQTTPAEIRQMEERGTRLILIDRRFAGYSTHYVGADDQLIGRMATQHLAEQGCRRIACIGGRNVSTALDRLNGYKEALRILGHPERESYIIHRAKGDEASHVSGFEAMRTLLALSEPPDGVFCLNDPTAMGALKAIYEAGLQTPHDIAVIGCGNVPYASELRVPLTSIDQESEMLGEHAARLALQLVVGKRSVKTPKTVLMTPKLVQRASSTRRS